MNRSIRQVSLLTGLAIIFNLTQAPLLLHANEFRRVFRYSEIDWNAETVLNALHEMHNYQTGLELEDPRRAQVDYWLDAHENREWKCTRKNDEEILSALERERAAAEQERRASNSQGRFFNLEKLVTRIRMRRFDYCQVTKGTVFVEELDKITASDGGDLVHLTALSDYMDSERLGKRIGRLIIRKSDQTSLNQLFEWSDDRDYVRENYERFSPCAAVTKVADKYETYLDYLHLPGNYRKCRQALKDWLDRISVCRFIDESMGVFDAASKFLKEKDSSNKISSGQSPERLMVSNDRYDSIFKYSSQEMTASYVTLALIMLDSYRWGLDGADPRRAEVSFWIDAARQEDSRCSIESDDAITTQLEREKFKANRVRRRAGSYVKEVFNLDSYVEHIRSEKASYCEARFGNRFLNELTDLSKNNFIDLCLLTRQFTQSSLMDAQRLGMRVAELIVNRSDQAGRKELDRALNPDSIREHYNRLSPCVGLLAIVDRYKGYYSLMTAKGNYQRLRPAMRNWIDKIAVCQFIGGSERVFEAATGFVRQKLNTL